MFGEELAVKEQSNLNLLRGPSEEAIAEMISMTTMMIMMMITTITKKRKITVQVRKEEVAVADLPDDLPVEGKAVVEAVSHLYHGLEAPVTMIVIHQARRKDLRYVSAWNRLRRLDNPHTKTFTAERR